MTPKTSLWSRLTGGWGSKAAVSAPVSARASGSPYGFLLSNGAEITPHQAWQLYKTSAAFAKIIDLIADNVATLKPLVKINGETVDGHIIEKFLARPGFNRTRRRLIKELAVQYLVTGTAHPHVYGNPSMFPVAIDVVKSKDITSFPGADGWPESFLFSEMTRSINFVRDGNVRDPRYLDSASGYSEILSIYDLDGDRRGIGLSRLNAIRDEVELRVQGIAHNRGLLEKGARLSGVLSFKDPMDSDQKAAVQAEAQAHLAGNGGVLVTAGGDMDYKPMAQTAKDMDFVKLMAAIEDTIVSRYNVPVTLFRTDAQTNNNYETAWNILYDQAVLPCFQVIFQGLAQVFSARLGVEVELVHDALTNPILARQASARARELFNGQLISRNEGRDMIGMEPVLGGDTILGPMGMVPVGEDMFTTIDVALGRDELDARNQRLAGNKPTDKEPASGKKPVTADRSERGSDDAKRAFKAVQTYLTSLAGLPGMNGHSVKDLH